MTRAASDVRFQWCHQPRISWFMYVGIVILCFLSIILCLTRDRQESRYSVVFEVKENTTQVHLFRLLWREGLWSLFNEEYESITPSLLDYLDRPREGLDTLIPLVERARNAIPESHQAVSTVSLGVTETFHQQEVKDVTKVDRLFSMIDRTFHRAFPFRTVNVLSINATDEVAYAWSAVSLLRKNSETRVALLSLGRYRCQVCFVPKTMDPTIRFLRFQKEINLYAKDYDQLGIDHARTKISRKFGPEVCDSHSPEESRFRICRRSISQYLDEIGMDLMTDLENEDVYEIYVRGLFYNFTVYGGLMQEHENQQTFKVEYIGARAKAACEDRRNMAPSICFELTYMYTLFTEKYLIDDEREIHVVRRIENGFASWPLGLAIAHAYD